MKLRMAAAAAVGLLMCGLAGAGELKSGPQPGKGVGPFNPLNVLNVEDPSQNGKDRCLV